jgi:hypothetical protein
MRKTHLTFALILYLYALVMYLRTVATSEEI